MARTYFLEQGSTGFFLYTNKGGARGKREYVMTGCGMAKRQFSAINAVEYATQHGGAVKMGVAAAVEHPC